MNVDASCRNTSLHLLLSMASHRRLRGPAFFQSAFRTDFTRRRSRIVGEKPYHSSTVSQNSFSRAHLYNRSRPESRGSCLRRGQARRHLTEDLLVVSGSQNTSCSEASTLRRPCRNWSLVSRSSKNNVSPHPTSGRSNDAHKKIHGCEDALNRKGTEVV